MAQLALKAWRAHFSVRSSYGSQRQSQLCIHEVTAYMLGSIAAALVKTARIVVMFTRSPRSTRAQSRRFQLML